MHAIGNVDSMGLVVFLAGEQRFCSPDSTFLFHDFAWGTNAAMNQTRGQWADLHEFLDFEPQSAPKSCSSCARRSRTRTSRSLSCSEKTSIQDAGFAKEKRIVQEIKDCVHSRRGTSRKYRLLIANSEARPQTAYKQERDCPPVRWQKQKERGQHSYRNSRPLQAVTDCHQLW